MRAIYLISDGPPPTLKVRECLRNRKSEKESEKERNREREGGEKRDFSLIMTRRNRMISLPNSANSSLFAYKKKGLTGRRVMRYDIISHIFDIFISFLFSLRATHSFPKAFIPPIHCQVDVKFQANHQSPLILLSQPFLFFCMIH